MDCFLDLSGKPWFPGCDKILRNQPAESVTSCNIPGRVTGDLFLIVFFQVAAPGADKIAGHFKMELQPDP